MNKEIKTHLNAYSKIGIFVLFFVITAAHFSYAQQKTSVTATHLSLPKKEGSSTSSAKQGPLPETVPGSLPDVVKKLEVLNQRVDQLESTTNAKLNRLESSYSDLKNNYLKLKQDSRRPECSADHRYSMNPVNNAKVDCGPYACSDITGLCNTLCTNTGDFCVMGAVCDTETQKCMWP